MFKCSLMLKSDVIFFIAERIGIADCTNYEDIKDVVCRKAFSASFFFQLEFKHCVI